MKLSDTPEKKKEEDFVPWCTKEGCKARRQGIKQESKKRQFGYALLFAVSSLLCFGIGGTQATHALNAQKINADYTHPNVTNAYDSCIYPEFIPDPEISE